MNKNWFINRKVRGNVLLDRGSGSPLQGIEGHERRGGGGYYWPIGSVLVCWLHPVLPWFPSPAVGPPLGSLNGSNHSLPWTPVPWRHSLAGVILLSSNLSPFVLWSFSSLRANWPKQLQVCCSRVENFPSRHSAAALSEVLTCGLTWSECSPGSEHLEEVTLTHHLS